MSIRSALDATQGRTADLAGQAGRILRNMQAFVGELVAGVDGARDPIVALIGQPGLADPTDARAGTAEVAAAALVVADA